MCGIAGYLGKKIIKDSIIENTFNLMMHRGPDSKGKFVEKDQKFNKVFLHTRLSIIDLKEQSNQPFENENYILIYNGEIYNYLEIKEDLKLKGHKFKTQSDTEVLLKSYIEYKEDCVNRFIGMWSFAIYDKLNKKLFLSRDIFGEKPLYYYYKNNEFIFGSEIKFIKSIKNESLHKNRKKILNLLNFGYKSIHQNFDSFYEDIQLLEPGCSITIDKNLDFKKIKYFKLNSINFNQNKKNYSEIVFDVQKLIVESLKLRLRSDVPVAFCLSGGIDSAFLASLAVKKLDRKINTFSIIDSDKRYNESENINKIIKDLNCDNYQIELKKKSDFFFDIEKLVKQHDGPISTISYYIHSFLANQISKSGYKVSISGTGADEIFTGYYDHYPLYFASIRDFKLREREIKKWRKHLMPLIRNKQFKDPEIYLKDSSNTQSIFGTDKDLRKFIKDPLTNNLEEKIFIEDNLLKNRMINELFHQVVPVILKHDDLNSMMYSIENRSPYLDKKLFEYSLGIPTKYFIQDGFQKKILRDCSKNILIDEVRLSRKKVGFNASVFTLSNIREIKDFLYTGNNKLSEYVDLNLFFNYLEKSNSVSKDDLNKFFFNLINIKIFLEQE